MLRLYILRHGQTDWNKVRRLQGRTDIPLNENGLELAKLAGEGMRGIHIDRVITSPLLRARQTAQMVLTGMELKNIPAEVDDRIQEISFGVLEGTSFINPEYLMPDPEHFYFLSRPERYQAPEGGENFLDVIRRTGEFLDCVASLAKPDEQLLVSTHGCASRGLLANICHVSVSDYWQGSIPKNCSVSIAEYDSDREEWKLLEKDHLYYEEPYRQQ